MRDDPVVLKKRPDFIREKMKNKHQTAGVICQVKLLHELTHESFTANHVTLTLWPRLKHLHN